jgi:hypothetical protein
MLPARMTARRLLLLLACLALAGGLSACNKQKIVTEASTEGTFINVGPLDYQVQISRQLNPADPEDHDYVQGLAAGTTQPTAQETWFAVFLRVENNGSHAAPSSDDFDIEDTEGVTYRPLIVSTANPFAYHAVTIPAHSAIPAPETAAANGPIQGTMLLFKIKLTSLQNRPLQLHVRSASGPQEGTVDLDV